MHLKRAIGLVTWAAAVERLGTTKTSSSEWPIDLRRLSAASGGC